MGRLARFIHFYTDEDDGADVGPTNIVSGNPPLSLVNAIAKKIRRLIQFGKCTVSGTDITCNNGVLKYGAMYRNIFDYTKIRQTSGLTVTLNDDGSINVSGVLQSNYPIVTDVQDLTDELIDGETYTLSIYPFQGTFLYPQIILKDSGGNTTYIACNQDASRTFTVDKSTYAIYQCVVSCGSMTSWGTEPRDVTFKVQLEKGSSSTDWTPYTEGFYTEGTPEEIRVTASGADDQTATASNLFAVGSIADEQDIISGTITRRCEAVVSDGTTPSGRYIGTVGEGNIIVCAKETGYSGAIASFTADKAEPLSGLVAEINPVQDLHGQPNPYPAGGGRNILPYFTQDSQTAHGVTWTKNSDGSISVSGTCTLANAVTFVEFKLPAGSYKFSNVGSTATSTGGSPGGIIYIRDLDNSTTLASINVGAISTGTDFTIATETNIRFYAVVQVDNVLSGTIYPMVRLASVSDSTYAPYSNECLITGWTGVSGEVAGVNLFDIKSFATMYPDLCSYDESTGELSVSGIDGILFRTGVPAIIPADKIDGGAYISCVAKNVTATNMRIRVIFEDGTARDTTGTGTETNWTNIGGQTLRKRIVAVAFNWSQAGTFIIKDLQINFGATASDYEKYQGEPISVSFPALGHNQWDEEWEQGRINTLTGENSNGNGIRAKNKIPIVPSAEYYALSGAYTGAGSITLYYYDINENFIESVNLIGLGKSFTTLANAYYMRFNVMTSAAVTYNHDISINYPSTVTSYEPYTNTVYGGSDEVIDGNGTITMGMVDLGTLTWEKNDSSLIGVPCFYATVTGIKQGAALIACSQYKVVRERTNINASGMIAIGNRTDATYVVLRDDAYASADATAFKTAMSGVQLCYELETPTTFTHEGQSVDTLVGQNNVFVDTGNVTAYVSDFTTEKVAGQSLSTTDGTNTVFVTSNVDPVELEVEYRTP